MITLWSEEKRTPSAFQQPLLGMTFDSVKGSGSGAILMNDPMTGNGWVTAYPHSVANRPSGSGPSGQDRKLPIGRYLTVRNPPDQLVDFLMKFHRRKPPFSI